MDRKTLRKTLAGEHAAGFVRSGIYAANFAAILATTLLLGCSVSHELSEAEKSMLLTESDFAEYGFKYEQKTYGKFEKTIDYLNRSTELGYQSTEGSELYVYSTVTIERSAAAALATELTGKVGVLVGLKSSGAVESPIKLTKPYGTRASLSLLKKDGKPLGNRFSAVIDKKVVMVVFGGLYFETEASFREFFAAKMQSIETFQNSK